MDIIPMQRFEETLKSDLEGLRKLSHKRDWSDLLALWVARHFLDLDDRQVLVACGMQGSGEEGIDMFWVQDGKKRVIVAQAEASAELNLRKSFSRRIVDKLRRALAALNDEELGQNRQIPIATAIGDYNDAVAKEYSIEFWAIIGGTSDKGLVGACGRFSKSDLSRYPRHTLRVIDASALLTQYCAEVQRLPYPNVTLDLASGEYFKHGENSILATVTANSVARAVKDAGLRIFETNARLPLLRSGINKEIANTLGDAEGRKHFWEYNNGLTVLCNEFGPTKSKLKLSGAQIVNGCQTAHTLFKNMNRLEQVQVMCRITRRADAAQSDRIRRATNLQNQMLERDLRSGDQVQKLLQLGFKKRGYFYERKRDEYKNCVDELGKVNMVAQFPKGTIDNLYLAQLSLAFWHQRPAPAKMQVRKLFVKAAGPTEEELPEGFYDEVFPEHVTAEELLLPYLVSNYLYDRFRIGYRPQFVKRTRRYMIQTHGNLTVLALLGAAMRSQYGLELPLSPAKKQVLGNLLIPRFEEPGAIPEFSHRFDQGVQLMLDGLDGWTQRASRKQSREEGHSDLRKIFVAGSTYKDILRDRRMKDALRRAERRMPDLP